MKKKTVKKPVRDTFVEEKLNNVVKEENIGVASELEEEAVEDGKDEDVESKEMDEEKEINPIEIIEEFSEASKNLDKKVTANLSQEQLETVLSDELSRVEDVESKLEKVIREKEKNINKETKRTFNNFWNGVSSGWYD